MLLPILGLTGLSLTLHRKLRLPFAYCPLLIACALCLLITAAGLAGGQAMYLCACAAAVGGALLLPYGLRRPSKETGLAVGGFALLALGCCLRFRGCVLFAYDDVSHWGSMARYLLQNGALPNACAQLITFSSYPPAAAAFIYYLCGGRFLSEGAMLAAQCVFVCTGLLPLFGESKAGSRPAHMLIALLTSALILTANVSIQTLSVDTLLAAVTLGGALLIARSRLSGRGLLAAVCVLCSALVLIKNSGLFFALFLLYAFYQRDRLAGGRRALRRLLPLLCAAAAFGLWQLHVSIRFSGGGRHAVSPAFYLQSLLEKWRSGVLWQCAKATVKAWINPLERYNQLLATLLAGIGGVWAFAYQPETRVRAKRFLAQTLACWAVWQVSTFLFMYVFSASSNEAVKLSGHARYAATMLTVLMGFFGAFVQSLCRQKPRSGRLWPCAAALLCMTALLAGELPTLVRPAQPSFTRQALDRHLAADNFDKRQGVVLVADAYGFGSDYALYMAKYLLADPDGTLPPIACVGESNLQTALPALLETHRTVLFLIDAPQSLAFARSLAGGRVLPLP